MPSFPTPGLAERLVHELRKGPIETSQLIDTLRRVGPSVTVQGVYKALRALRTQEIVFLYRKEAMLNVRWLHELEAFTSLAEHAYRDPTANSGHFLQLRDGDRITYAFKNPILVDAFWNHVLYILFEATPSVDRWYAYASHCWFLIGRRKEEIVLQEFMKKHGIRYLFTVGHHMPLDRAIKNDFDGINSQYAMLDEPLFAHRPNQLGIVLNVFGDYVIEAQYDKHTVERIEAFYRKTTTLDARATAELESLVSISSRIKFIISKNAAKAQKLARMFEKKFYFGKK